METAPLVRRNVLVGAGLAGLLVLGALLLALNVASGDLHWNDMPWANDEPVADFDSVFAEGQPLHCSGIENMAPPAALAALKAEGFSVRIYHDGARSSEHVKSVPEGAVLQEVAAAPGSTRAIMFVMTPEHPRFDEGYIGSLPPQDC